MLTEVLVPDIGAYSNVDIIEISVAPGDLIKKDATLMTLETDKATVEVPSPFEGVVKVLHVKVGDKVSQGSLIVTMEPSPGASGHLLPQGGEEMNPLHPLPTLGASSPLSPLSREMGEGGAKRRVRAEEGAPRTAGEGIVHAGPGVRRFARELGVELARVVGTGPKNRILKVDIQAYVKRGMQQIQSGAGGGSGFSVVALPQVDFAKFGEIVREPLSRIKKLSGSFLHRNWVSVPHVTQFEEADFTEIENYRKQQQPIAQQQNLKLTPLVFIMKAAVAALKAFPNFNASLDQNGAELILKKYFHLGVAVDTPNGLVVPVIRDVDQKGILTLAKELGEVSEKARLGQLSGEEMQGGCFTISSLGGIGGTAFTPIINVPDVAILGVSKASIKPVYEDGEFKPRLRLPLSLSYDHRVIDGAEGARFITFLAKQLSDISEFPLS